MLDAPSINLLRNQIDFSIVPFSDRGSRLLIFLNPEQHNLYIRLAERLTSLEPNIEAYLHRPPFIHDLCFVDQHGEKLAFETTTYPHALYFNTRLGDFGLVFQDRRSLSFGIPPQTIAGLRFYVSPQYWKKTEQGGEFKSIRDLFYTTNAEVIDNQIIPENGGYLVQFIIRSGEDSTVTIQVGSSTTQLEQTMPFSQAYEAAETRWKAWFAKAPPVAESFRAHIHLCLVDYGQ